MSEAETITTVAPVLHSQEQARDFFQPNHVGASFLHIAKKSKNMA